MGQSNENGKKKRRTRRKKFSEEFKRDAVELVRSTGRPIAHVAEELGIYDSTLGNWVRKAKVDDGEREGTTSEDAERIAELEAQLAEARMERDLLKRTVAFWVKESQP